MPDCDVLIVGAGPVGQVSALLLAQQGLQVVVLERWEKPYSLPRAVALAHDVVRVLHTVGMGDRLTHLLEPWGHAGQELLLESSDGERLTKSEVSLTSLSGHPQMSSFSQPDLELLLEDRVHEVDVIDQHRGATVRSLRSRSDRVDVTAVSDEQTEFVLSARYVVGCDGANSLVRQQIGAPVNDLQFDRDWMVVDVVPRTPLTGAMRNIGQRLGPGRPTTFVAAGQNRRRFEFMIMPGEDAVELDTDDATWKLLQPWGFDPTNSELVRHALYTFRARWATRWRAGRILLAGDAAHQMPPFLGQGLNSGIRDAANLAWRLALVLKGTAPDSLLDDYVGERSDQVTTIVRETVVMGGLICTTDPEEANRRDELLKQVGRMDVHTDWPLHTGTLGEGQAAGTLGLQARVGIGNRIGLLDGVLSNGGKFTLLGADTDPVALLDPALAAGWSELGGVGGHFGSGGWTDLDCDYGNWFDALNARVVLIRPDFHVFGTSSGDQVSTNVLVGNLLSRTST